MKRLTMKNIFRCLTALILLCSLKNVQAVDFPTFQAPRMVSWKEEKLALEQELDQGPRQQYIASDNVSRKRTIPEEKFIPGEVLVVRIHADSSSILNGGYPIDSEGYVDFPIIGKVPVHAGSYPVHTLFL